VDTRKDFSVLPNETITWGEIDESMGILGAKCSEGKIAPAPLTGLLEQ
jgi:hypothetical protein